MSACRVTPVDDPDAHPLQAALMSKSHALTCGLGRTDIVSSGVLVLTSLGGPPQCAARDPPPLQVDAPEANHQVPR